MTPTSDERILYGFLVDCETRFLHCVSPYAETYVVHTQITRNCTTFRQHHCVLTQQLQLYAMLLLWISLLRKLKVSKSPLIAKMI